MLRQLLITVRGGRVDRPAPLLPSAAIAFGDAIWHADLAL